MLGIDIKYKINKLSLLNQASVANNANDNNDEDSPSYLPRYE